MEGDKHDSNRVTQPMWDFSRLPSDVPFMCCKKVPTIKELQHFIEYNSPLTHHHVRIDYEEIKPERCSVLRNLTKVNELEGVGICLQRSDEEFYEEEGH
ncbi:hypothetical protein GBA52_013278 [Prunus armeniaca]|nr:hypothetical protein GBA52_013278 [Prunus armeniaca]